MAGSDPAARRSGDGWIETADGRRFWGRAGAAGLLAVSPAGSVLLQHRIPWSHFGGTWGLPGGARDLGETALDGALREAREETGIDTGSLRPRFASMLDLGVWSYTTVAADAPEELPVTVADAESTALAWVPAEEVAGMELHPGLADSWPALREQLAVREALVVDAANVVGSRPDGWWRDRRGAAERLLRALARLQRDGLPTGEQQGLVRRWPEILVVLEGAARGAVVPEPVRVIEADAAGDDAVVGAVEHLVARGRRAAVVTSDRALRDRARRAGGSTHGSAWLRELLDATADDPSGH